MSLCTLCAQLDIEAFAFRDTLERQPYGASDDLVDDYYEEVSGSEEEANDWEEMHIKSERENRIDLGSIGDITQRKESCVLCRQVDRYFAGQTCGPNDTFEAHFSSWCYITTKSRGKRRISRIDVNLIPETGDTSWGPFLPQEGPLTSQRRTIIELQECSDPVPTTSDFSTMPRPVSLSKESQFSGRLTSAEADLGLIAYWINTCREQHGNECTKSIWPSNVPQTLTSLLLIDVHRMCIVDAPPGSSYVALSYCWGRVTSLRHLKHNSNQLRTECAFLELASSIPDTIRDAILLVKGIHEQYLWVDALCIIQDDPVSQSVQLAQMGLVYSLANFVIIAAAGDDANAGLPGIRPETRRHKQEVLRLGEKSMVTVIDGSYYGGVESSTWVTRAWTMQEKALAKRTLIFTEEQIYWRCWGATWLEETVLENVAYPYIKRPHAIAGPSDVDFSAAVQQYYQFYEKLVVNYMRRQLSFKSDTVNAFTGISQALSAVGNDRFHWGLPESQFGYALSWNLLHEQTRNMALCPIFQKDGSVHEVQCPSWSWTARMHGSINSNWINWGAGSTEEESDIIFYRQNNDGGLHRIQHDGSRGKELPSYQNQSSLVLQQWKGHPQLIDAFQIPASNQGLVQGHLHFWTSSATVWIRCQSHLPRGPLYSLLVPTEYGKGFEEGGNVYIDSSAELNLRGKEQNIVAPDNILSHDEDHDKEDFAKVNVVFRRELIVIGRIGRYRNSLSNSQLSVLVIEWDGDLARRVGITSVKESVWVRLGNREWKRVILG